MAKYVFPAVFTPEGDQYSVNFPDVPSCYTCGDGLADAIDMAEDVLALRMCDIEDENKRIPAPTNANHVAHEPNEIVTLISCDTLAYRRKMDSRAVKKTLTIPSWLNAMAEEAGVNFSGILQEALKQHLQIPQK